VSGSSVAAEANTSAWDAISTWSIALLYRLALEAHWVAVASLTFLRRAPVSRHRGKRVLLTGTFYSENWILNHLKPLASSQQCNRIWVVTTFPIPAIDNIEAIYPPSWLVRCVGEVPARLLIFVITAVKHRPDFVGGFHLLPNGLIALLIARFLGCRSLYFCGGGPREVEGGGYYSGSRSFRFLKAPDPIVEKKLLRAVAHIDLIITMGRAARRFFQAHGVRNHIEVVPGGIDPEQLEPANRPKIYDLILVGRLHPVKRIDLFLRTVRQLAERNPGISAVVVGGGELEHSLKALAIELGIANRVTFAGQQSDVGTWLQQSKVFVLTSKSEGLSLAMMEAMTAGLPCVVPNVGELSELVEHGKTGFLVEDQSPNGFSVLLEPLLRSDTVREAFSRNGKAAASHLTTTETARRWNDILSAF
jgi:L-malate glycosyltransferase